MLSKMLSDYRYLVDQRWKALKFSEVSNLENQYLLLKSLLRSITLNRRYQLVCTLWELQTCLLWQTLGQ